MSVKIGSLDLSDVVVGEAGGGKTNIDKIVVGNADGTGTVLWQRTNPVPTAGGVWRGVVLNDDLTLCEYNEADKYWFITTSESVYILVYSVYYLVWQIRDSLRYYTYKICDGDGTEKRLVNEENGIDLTWSET